MKDLNKCCHHHHVAIIISYSLYGCGIAARSAPATTTLAEYVIIAHVAVATRPLYMNPFYASLR
jgi:hypothetical protein